MAKLDGPYDTEPYDIERVRRDWIGRTSEVVEGRYPVEHDPIARHCQMVEDRNPLFLEPDAARAAGHDGVIAPPVMADYFAGGTAWPDPEARRLLRDEVPTRGERLINLSQEWEFHAPIRVGDRLSKQVEIVDVYEKSIQLDPQAVWIVVETRITNQDGALVAVGRNVGLSHREPEEVAADAASEGSDA